MGKGILMLKKVGLLCLFLLFFSGCQGRDPRLYYLEEINLEKNAILEEKVEQPYIGIIKNNYLIQPTSGTYTKIKPKSYYEASVICDEEGIHFWSKGKLEKYGKKVKVYRVRDEKLVWEQNFFEHRFLPLTLPENELYVLRVSLTQGRKDLNYDFPFYYLSTSAYKDNISRVMKTVTAHIKEFETQVGNVAVKIKKATADGSIEGSAKVVVSVDGTAGKEYLDKKYQFHVHTGGGSKWEETIYNKKRGNYDRARKAIPLMESGEWYEKNGKYIQILDHEIYAIEGKEVYTLFRKDKIDDDFLMDEVSDMKFLNIGWIEKSYYFIAYGNMGEDIPKYANHQGMTVFEWDGKAVHPVLFAEIDMANVEEHIQRHLLVKKEESRIYWLQQGSYYQFDIKLRAVRRTETPYNSEYNKDLPVYYWQAENDKKNQYVYWNDATTQKIYGVMKEDTCQQILGVNSEGIFIGEYQLANTIERLNGGIEYGFDKIVLYAASGAKKKEFLPPKNTFYAKIQWQNEEAVVPIVQRNTASESFEYRKIKEEKITTSKKMPKSEKARELPGVRVPFQSERMRILNGTVKEREMAKDKTLFMSLEEEPEVNYFLVKGYGSVYVAPDLGSALRYGQEYPVYEVYNYGLLEEKKVYESKNKKPYFQIENFVTEHLSGALPNGQQVAALSMLLRYYSPKVAGQLPIAFELTEYTKRNNQSGQPQVDMHEGFVGNLYEDTPNQVTGSYIGPLVSVARKRVGVKAQDISGSTLNQIMTFVSAEKPVLVMVGKNLSIPEQTDKQVWETPSGYMEVSDSLHSVVVIGFDTTFIYYADPLTGNVEKGIRRVFEQSYQSFGKQAMVILD